MGFSAGDVAPDVAYSDLEDDSRPGGVSVAPSRILRDLASRMAGQHERLTGPPIPAGFTYDRNGLRLGIAALEDELRELYDEWADGKKNLGDPAVAAAIRHEALDVAAVAMLIYRNVPAPVLGQGERD